MMDFKISKILAKDLLQERSKLIKDGQLTFNRIVIVAVGKNAGTVNLYYDADFLASVKFDCCPESYTTFDFQLADGSMKLSFNEGDVCDPPDPYERIRKPLAEITAEIETWKRE